VTTVTYLFIIQKREKRKEILNQEKINKRKEKY